VADAAASRIFIISRCDKSHGHERCLQSGPQGTQAPGKEACSKRATTLIPLSPGHVNRKGKPASLTCGSHRGT